MRRRTNGCAGRTAGLFLNGGPVEAMIEGGIPTMLEVRRYVDAVRGGL